MVEIEEVKKYIKTVNNKNGCKAKKSKKHLPHFPTRERTLWVITHAINMRFTFDCNILSQQYLCWHL